MKVVLDTNILVSGIFFPSGPPRQILLHWERGKLDLVILNEIFDEYSRTTEDIRVHYPDTDIAKTLNLVLFNSEICEPEPLAQPVCKDLKDDKFIACAIAGKAKIIVSGDKHLLAVSGYQGVEIIRPKAFMEKYLSLSND